MAKCGAKTEVYSRVCGYFRPVSNWNVGKKQEFKDRKKFAVPNVRDVEYHEKRVLEAKEAGR